MARILVVFHRKPWGQWRSTYDSHLNSFSRVPGHTVLYLNTALPSVPDYLRTFNPDLVVFHYTFLAVRQHPQAFADMTARISFLAGLQCRKALIPHDEQAHADLLCRTCLDFDVTHVFTPAPASEWRAIYRELDFDRVAFRTVLTGYIDDRTVARLALTAGDGHERPVDIGYRSWSIQPSYGRHGLLKAAVGEVFAERAPDYGLVTDISSDYRDAFLGDSWFDFLLSCKYTIGVEGGTSILDYDGTIAERSRDYLQDHPNASFEQVEAACFPDRDGEFGYFLLGPRHLEAVITKTCQALIEGEYGGALKAGVHYIPIKRDFSNLDEVLSLMKSDAVRVRMVEQAYADVVESRRWTYEAFAQSVLDDCLGAVGPSSSGSRLLMWVLTVRNRLAMRRRYRFQRFMELTGRPALLRARVRLIETAGPQAPVVNLVRYVLGRSPAQNMRDAATFVVGEERLWRWAVAAGNLARRMRGRPTVDPGAYTPTQAEVARRERKAARRRGRP